VIVMRHGRENPDQAYTDPLNVEHTRQRDEARHRTTRGATPRAQEGDSSGDEVAVGTIVTRKLMRAQECREAHEPGSDLHQLGREPRDTPDRLANENKRSAAALRKMAAMARRRNHTLVVHTQAERDRRVRQATGSR